MNGHSAFELERLLVRSAELDVPSAAARSRALRGGLEVLRARPRRARWPLVLSLVAAAAGVALLLSSRLTPRAVVAAAEPIDVLAPRSGGSVSSSAGTPPSRAGTSPSPASTSPRAPCPALVVAHGATPLIDDFERPDAWILMADGRRGSWVTYDDGTGTQTPPSHSALLPTRLPSPRSGSRHALHVSGTHFTKWGVTFGTELADAACYDASAYAGVSFWAKGPGEVRVGLQMIDVQDAKHGGLCTADCYDTHRKIVELGSSFREYRVRWEELRQLYDAGPPVAFDPKRVRFLEFGVAPEHTPFDLWIDDVTFFR